MGSTEYDTKLCGCCGTVSCCACMLAPCAVSEAIRLMDGTKNPPTPDNQTVSYYCDFGEFCCPCDAWCCAAMCIPSAAYAIFIPVGGITTTILGTIASKVSDMFIFVKGPAKSVNAVRNQLPGPDRAWGRDALMAFFCTPCWAAKLHNDALAIARSDNGAKAIDMSNMATARLVTTQPVSVVVLDMC